MATKKVTSSASTYDSDSNASQTWIETSAAGANTYNIQDSTDEANLFLRGASGDVINIEAASGEFQIKARGKLVTLTSDHQTIMITLANAATKAGAQDVKLNFLDGSIDLVKAAGVNGLKLGGVALTNKLADITGSVDESNNTALNVFDNSSANDLQPSYAVTASASSVNEGATVNFTLQTTNVAQGSTFNYVLGGVHADDVVGGSLVGTVTIDSFGQAIIPVSLVEDHVTDGAETMTISIAGKTTSVSVADTSKAPEVGTTYTLAAASSTVTEGQSLTFTVTRTGDLSAAKTLVFSGAGDASQGLPAASVANDFTPGSGTVTFAAGSATATFTIAATSDTSLQGLEGLKVSLFDGATSVASTGVMINDDPNVGQTFTLTTGQDNVVGTAGNDTINAPNAYLPGTSTAMSTLTGLDVIDGGAGSNTLNITDDAGGKVDLTLPSSIKNIQTLNLTSVGSVTGNAATDEINLKTLVTSGLTSADIHVKQGATLTVDAATTTALDIANDDNVTVVGGGGTATFKATSSTVTVGDSTFAANQPNAYTSISINVSNASDNVSGRAYVYDNSGTNGAVGSTLTTVSLRGINNSSTVTGDGVTTVNLTNINNAVTLTNTKAHALTLNVKADNWNTFTDATATSVAITATKATATEFGSGYTDSAIYGAFAKATTISVAGDAVTTLNNTDLSKLTTVTYTGTGSLTTDLHTVANLTKVDASGATGNLDVTIAGTNTAATPVAQSVIGGSGDDKVTITGTLGSSSTLSLGAGSDSVAVSGAGVVTAGAVVDAGADVDTLALSIVGSANVGAFKNFENFDVAGITANFDQAVLDTHNTVQNFIGSAQVGAAVTLQNLGAGVGFVVTGDMNTGAAQVVTLTQATGGALTITTNVDESKANTTVSNIDASFVASNATSVKAVFDNNNVDTLADGYANTSELEIVGTKATTLTIVSGGSEVVNTLNFTGALSSGNDLLTSATITGSQALVLNYLTGGGTLKLATVDASGQTAGGLSFDLDDLTATGTLKLGAGDDKITLTTPITDTAATSATVQTINGIEKGSAEDLTTQKDFDVINFANAIQALDVTAAVGVDHSISNGVYTFIGAGAANLAAAIAQIAGDLNANEAVVFDFAGTNYVYGSGATNATTDDMLVKLTGVTGITGLDTIATGQLYLF